MSPKLKLSHQLQIYPSVSTDVSQWKIYRSRPVKIEEELNEKLTEKRLQQVANISAMPIWDKNSDEKLGLHPTILQQFPVALISDNALETSIKIPKTNGAMDICHNVSSDINMYFYSFTGGPYCKAFSAC